jgi:hypothetical protein
VVPAYTLIPDQSSVQRQLHSAQPYADAATEQHNPFPQGQQLGGETFASALLLSLSCTPLLKQHMLRTLQLTDEELASLELAIAEAYNNWNYQVRLVLICTPAPVQYVFSANPILPNLRTSYQDDKPMLL